MNSINDLLPDIDILLTLEPEELAPTLLELARRNTQNGIFHLQNITTIYEGTGIAATRVSAFPRNRGNCSPPGGHRALGITAAAILTDL